VAGIIAAQANNGLGGVGVAYNVQIMPIKAAQYSGVLASSDIAEAIYYAVQHGADVINMSFGGYARSQLEEDALAVAFGQAVLVAAAGNDGKVNLPCPFGRDMYPAAYNWVLGVMASTPGGGRAGFSNYDCTPHDSHEYELMAPGVDVWSTLPNGQYAAWDGTSMATPIVSGIAALLRTKWSDKDVYSSRFIMGQIAANTQGGIGGVADAYAALTVAPRPELSYLEHWLFDTTAQAANNDDDGIVDAGETIDLAIVIRNHWGKADPVTVTLEAWAEGAYQPDPYVTMITGTVDYGAVGSFNVDDNG
jgi:subtilisin family serine protease